MIPLSTFQLAIHGDPVGGRLVIFTGVGQTDSQGYQRIDLPISNLGAVSSKILSIVATPLQHGDVDMPPRPNYLVARIGGGATAIWSFAVDGDWVPSVEFSWLCLVQMSDTVVD